jgi:hypothetical protein
MTWRKKQLNPPKNDELAELPGRPDSVKDATAVVGAPPNSV